MRGRKLNSTQHNVARTHKEQEPNTCYSSISTNNPDPPLHYQCSSMEVIIFPCTITKKSNKNKLIMFNINGQYYSMPYCSSLSKCALLCISSNCLSSQQYHFSASIPGVRLPPSHLASLVVFSFHE